MDNERHAIESTASEIRDLRSKSELSAGLDAPLSREQRVVIRCKLIFQCARILKNQLSEHAEDWPKSMPKKVLREIEKLNGKQKLIAADIRQILERI